jgi:hypothetical protein
MYSGNALPFSESQEWLMAGDFLLLLAEAVVVVVDDLTVFSREDFLVVDFFCFLTVDLVGGGGGCVFSSLVMSSKWEVVG